MSQNRKSIWPTLLMSATLIGAGGVAGFFLRPVLLPVAVSADPEQETESAEHGHGSNVVEILETALNNLDLKTGKLDRRDYFDSIRIPAEVVERIPQGRRSIASTVAGRIKRVHITKGQAIRPGTRLFDIQVTDPELSESQVQLINVMAEIAANQKQIDRLEPLVSQGVVANKRLIDIKLERDKLIKKREALQQSLGLKGMSDAQIADLMSGQQLLKDVGVFAPGIKAGDASNASESITIQTSAASLDSNENDYFTVESVNGLEGTQLEIGDSLCELTHHSELLIKGFAFEKDIERIATAMDKGWKFSAHFGPSTGNITRENLPLYQIENHVDPDSQTFPVFVEIRNEIASQHRDESNRTFVNWRFKPGQRTHLDVPVEVWEKQWVVPIEAIVYEGPQAFVFQKINHTHETPEGTIHEFAKTSVKVLHKDEYHAVLAKSDFLKSYEEYALDKAYQLNLILKAAASGGGHGHSHDGHSHPH